MVSESDVREALGRIHDPEIPSCSIADLGMIERVEVGTDGAIEVDLLPTFLGCPARDVIRAQAEQMLRVLCDRVTVRMVYAPPWTTDRITDRGRAALKEYGISPSGTSACPYCGSSDTTQDSAFGPTPCRATMFCNACRNVFEGFKEKGGHGGSASEASDPPSTTSLFGPN